VTTFLLALGHASFATVQYHAFGDVNPIVSILTTGGAVRVSALPFQPLGLVALIILFLMAATSHDFWLRTLTAPTWKALHMSVYAAYALICLHVALGVLQAESSLLPAAALVAPMTCVIGLHLAAAVGERAVDEPADGRAGVDGYVDVCAFDDIAENRARIVCLSGERVAVFRYEGRVAALSNVCQHQNGPLGEGRIVNGCVVCPWHGYEYLPDTGAAPPPFTEKVPTFDAKVVAGRVLVHPTPRL